MAVLTEDQGILRDTARSWAQERAPIAAFRRLRDSESSLGYAPDLFAQIAAMGWTGVVVPEAHGGSDFGYVSLGLILEQLGRTLVATPLVSSTGAAAALVLGGSAAQKQAWLPGLVEGQVIAALAVDEGAHHAPRDIRLSAVRTGDNWRLTGKKTFVQGGVAASLFVVAARSAGCAGDADGISLFAVAGDVPGIRRQPRLLIDGRDSAEVTFDEVTVPMDALLGKADAGSDLLDRTLDRMRACLAAEMLGSATQAFETTLAYLKQRVQFGRPIGAFQALQHRAAKMFSELELTRSCVEAALVAIDALAPDIAKLASLAKARAGDTLHLVTNEMIQMHGGIGMTDAHDAGLYLKRARVCEAAFGSAAFHRDRYARLNHY